MSEVRKDSDYETAVTAALRDVGQPPEPRHRFYSEEPWMLLDDMIGSGPQPVVPGAAGEGGGAVREEGAVSAGSTASAAPDVSAAGPSVTGDGSAELVVVQVCHRGRLSWAALDPESPHCYEWLVEELGLRKPNLLVPQDLAKSAGLATHSMNSSNDLRKVLLHVRRTGATNAAQTLRLEVELGSADRLALLAQSFSSLFQVVDHAPQNHPEPVVVFSENEHSAPGSGVGAAQPGFPAGVRYGIGTDASAGEKVPAERGKRPGAGHYGDGRTHRRHRRWIQW